MSNYIIVGILVVVLYFGLRSSIKHFRGEGGCCGGGTYKARMKKLNTVVGRKTFTVEGMSCQHCVNRVMEAVNSIDGASALVKLKKGQVIVSLERPVSNEIIRDAIEKAGYKVTEIKEGSTQP
ncbi:MAG: copper ion binding protein [Eubacteriales bacterium]|nr:copper ion binding protein [Eubacteriales bacterium]